MACLTRRPLRCWPVVLLWLLLPAGAQAHSPVQGAGDFINGMLHPLLSPAHVLIILGLGFMAGRGRIAELKMPMTVFAPLSAIALLLTTTGWIKAVHPSILICIALAPAAFLALEKTPPPAVLAALFGVGALALGMDSMVEGGGPSAVAKMLLGNWLSLNVLVADIAIYVSLAGEAKWLKIALRIAGSWIIAISLLVLAFSFRK